MPRLIFWDDNIGANPTYAKELFKGIAPCTVEFYKEIGIDSATISDLIPFPNTPIFNRLEAEGRILTKDWYKYNGKKDVVFSTRPYRLQSRRKMSLTTKKIIKEGE